MERFSKFQQSLPKTFTYQPSLEVNNRNIRTMCEICSRYSVEKVILEIPQNSQENTCARVSLKRDSGTCVFLRIFKDNVFYRTRPVAASECCLFRVFLLNNFILEHNKVLRKTYSILFNMTRFMHCNLTPLSKYDPK